MITEVRELIVKSTVLVALLTAILWIFVRGLRSLIEWWATATGRM